MLACHPACLALIWCPIAVFARPQVYAFLASPEATDANAVLGLAMKLGEVNFRTMALLDKGHTTRWMLDAGFWVPWLHCILTWR